MRLEQILVLGILLFCKSLCSQENIREKIYITSDSLSYIHLLPNQKFGYVSYAGTSPLFYNIRNKGKKVFCGPSFVIHEFGSGKYTITTDKLKLNFTVPENSIDSVLIKETMNNTDSIQVKIIFKSYVESQNVSGIGIGSSIKSKDNFINLNTMFEDFASFTVDKKRLPMDLIINDKYILKITNKTNQDITLFVNDFKKFKSENIENKIFNFNELIDQLKE